MPPPTHQFDLTLQGDFVHCDADANNFRPSVCGAFGSPRHLFHDQFDRLEPPLAGSVVAVTDANKLITIPVTQFFRAFLAGLQSNLGTHNRNLPGKCTCSAAADAALYEGAELLQTGLSGV